MVAPSTETYLQASLDQSVHFNFAVDQDLQVRCFNRSGSRVFAQMGFELKLGTPLGDYLKGSPEKLAFVQRALNGEKFSVCEYWDALIYRTDYSPIYNSARQQIGARILGRAMNYWEHDETDEVPLNQEEKNAFWPHVVVFGRDSLSRSFSQQHSWERFTGQTFEQYDGYGWFNACHPDFRTTVQNIWNTVSSCKKARAFSFKCLLWNHQLQMYKHTLIHSTPQYDSCGTLVYWYCSGIDVHELMETQEELAVATQRLKMILKAGQIGTWDWDLKTGQLKGDKMHSQVLGREHAACIPGDDVLDQVIDRPALEKALQATREQGVPYDIEFQVKWPDGSIHWVAGKGELHVAEDGNRSLIGVNWDITLRKQMEEERVKFLKNEEEMRSSKQAEEFERKRAEEAEENQRRQEEFIDTVCHEIRNPLVGIYGGVHLATEELNSVLNLHKLDTRISISMERIKVHLTSILKCAEQQKVLVDDVLDMSKLQNNRIELVSIPFQLSSSFELVVDMFRSRVEEKQLKLTTDLPSQEVTIKADTNRLQQVIVNLISNAVKFTHRGEITVIAKATERNGNIIVEVSVQDSGIGISKEDIPLLFDRFSQIRKSHKRAQYGGSGLGLAISKRLVEAMGGKITVESSPGVGTKFSFFIKAERATQEDIAMALLEGNANDSMESDITSTNMRILVVDDNSLNQKILASYLEKAGHCVQLASDGFEAVQKGAQQHFDIIFMDIEMPNMNGLEATTALRQREQEHLTSTRSVIIGLSGNARKEKIDAALEAGMDFYLTKPYHKDEIMKAISKVEHSSRSRMRKSGADNLEDTRSSKCQKTEK